MKEGEEVGHFLARHLFLDPWASRSDRFADSFDFLGWKALLLVPLQLEDNPLGVFSTTMPLTIRSSDRLNCDTLVGPPITRLGSKTLTTIDRSCLGRCCVIIGPNFETSPMHEVALPANAIENNQAFPRIAREHRCEARN